MRRSIILVSTTLLCASGFAAGQDREIEIHGFGGWAYGETDDLNYQVGKPDGEYGNAEFTLNITARPLDRLTIVGQIKTEIDSHHEEGFEIDYAFAEWYFADLARLRIGRVKHPFGIYAEVFDVGTLRPFYTLPQGMYGPQGFTAKAYNGIGLTGIRPAGAWDLQYDLYLGEIAGDYAIPSLLTGDDPFLGLADLGFEVQDTVGGRIQLQRPNLGVNFGASAYAGDEEVQLQFPFDVVVDREVFGLHGEFLRDPWLVRGEWGELDNEAVVSESAYLEAAFRFGEHWQVAARWDYSESELVAIPELALLPPVFLEQALCHEDLGIGVNYWFSPELVVRLSFHQVEGNRFAFPDDPASILALLTQNVLDEDTELLVVGAHFSF